MPRNYMQQNLQNASFKGQDLSYANFADADLRGADFTDANLTGADFSNVKTGIRPLNTVILFIVALIVSAFSGYLATLAGQTIQGMMASSDTNVRVAGIASMIIIVLFIVYAYLKGVGKGVKYIMIPAAGLAIVVAILPFLAGLSSGMGALYLILSLLLVVIMFVVGTAARAAAGSLSNVLFIVVALTGGLFAKSLGGGVGTAIAAISCAMISKRALKGVKGFESLSKIALFITTKFGTSFRHAELANANFSHLYIRNSDFTDADIARANWFDSKKINCITQNETSK